MRNLKVPKPPIAEQVAIEARISAMDSRLAVEAEYVAKLKLLKSGLLDDLLTGRVRVADRTTP